MNRKTVKVDDLLISYLEAGERQSIPSVILLHGWGSEAAVWQKVIEALVGIGRHVVALDMPGFGHSSQPTRPFDVSQYISVLQKFLSIISIKEYDIVAHSFGARITIKGVAEKSISPIKIVMTGAAGKRDVDSRMKIRQTLGTWGGKLKSTPIIGSIAKSVGQKMRSQDYAQLQGVMAETFKLVVNEDLSEYAQQISVPTLLIWGEQDNETTLQQGRDLNNLIKGSQLKVFADSGHYVFIDKTEKFNQEVLLFLQES